MIWIDKIRLLRYLLFFWVEIEGKDLIFIKMLNLVDDRVKYGWLN